MADEFGAAGGRSRFHCGAPRALAVVFAAALVAISAYNRLEISILDSAASRWQSLGKSGAVDAYITS
jgi:hypothetical protein